MNKAVLISIQPKWCELIASGRKTIEVRKTKPKIPTPFKCYIYQTKRTWIYNVYSQIADWQRKVIGEFVCDEIHSILQVGNMNSRQYDYRAVTGDDTLLNDDVFDFACISKKDVNTYLKGQKGYGWHISDLKIYDKPKELGEFHQPCECLDEYEDEVYCDCFNCDYARDSDYGVIACRRTITRPLQSWCYVERLVGEE